MTAGDDETKPGQTPESEGDEWKFPSWRRVGEFVANILQLERCVASLREENKRLREELRALQRQVDEQGGKLEVLSDFVRNAVHDKVDSRAEKAAIRAVETMLAFTRGSPREIE